MLKIVFALLAVLLFPTISHAVIAQYCGDYVCNGNEPQVCPQDCGLPNIPPPSIHPVPPPSPRVSIYDW